MDKIVPSAYYVDVDPTDEAVLDSDGWYETQTCRITNEAELPFLLAQGWVVIGEPLIVWSLEGESVYGWDLSRKVLKPDLALKDLITQVTSAYNEGRTINDTRYDEILAVWNVGLDKTEDEMITLDTDDTTWEGLIETLITTITSDWTTHNADVTGDLDTYGASERARIDTKFDAQLADQKQSLIDRGLYNTTVWNSVDAGIERERAVADTDLEDKILEVQIKHKDRLYALKTDMRAKVMAARDRLHAALHDGATGRLKIRNEVMVGLINFMERREDGYPDLTSVADVTSALGASNVSYPSPT